jgi:phage recombination protein Bet
MTLPPTVTSRGLDVAQWNTLCNSLFPGAKSDSVLMAVDYCRARGLDIMKKPCHIVPISVKDGDGWKMRDVVMPGIYEYRITAHNTKQYLGHTKPEYGDKIPFGGVEAPEWCEMVMKRLHHTGAVVEYPVRVYFAEVCATKKKDGEVFANERWSKAPIQMLTKCCEAAGLREAFPDELGGTQTDDEMYGRTVGEEIEIKATVISNATPPGTSSPPAQRRSRKPETTEPQSTSDHGGVANTAGRQTCPEQDGVAVDRITASQQKLIEQRLKNSGISPTEFCAVFEIGEIKELPFDSMHEATGWIATRSEETK